jgi:hypothetical protein
MTMTAPITLFEAPEMSDAAPKFVVREEVKIMTTANALDCAMDAPVTRTAPSHGLDRAVKALAVAMLKWSREHESRSRMSRGEHSRRLQARDSALRREADALRMTQRIGL